MASGSAMDHDEADPWLQHLTTELNSHTWMTISGGGEGIIRTNRGTRPGSSWADVVFALLVRRVLRRRTELLPERQEPLLEWDGVLSFEPTRPDIAAATLPLAFGDMVWADDLATPMVADDPTLLAAQAASEASALADAFAEHAMQLSFGPLKTAVVLALRGAGSRAARRSAFCRRSTDADSGFPVLREHYPADFLPAVDSYRHLGSIQSFDGSMRREIQQRVGQAWGAFREGRRKLYKNKLVAPIRRSAMLTGLVVSKLLVGAGTWPPLRKGEYKMLRAALYGVFRAALCVSKLDDQQKHACSIRSLLSTSSPVALLHAARLRYAGQMVKHAPVHLWAITKGDRAYCELMLGSFDWLFERVGRTCGLPRPRSSWPSWQEVMQGHPGKYKGWIKRALALEQLVDKCAADHVELYKLCRALSGTLAAPSDDFVQAPPVEACLICRKGFASRLAWASHAARLHQYRTVAPQLAQGCVCLGCGKTYANTGRLKRHLDASLSCQRTWGSFVPEDASATAHSQMPPHVAAGAFQDASLLPVASSFEDAIARSLDGLDPCTTETALDVFKSFVQPLSALRAAAERTVGATDPACSVAAQVVILLHPGVVCDTPCGHRARPSLDENEFPIFAPLKPFLCGHGM